MSKLRGRHYTKEEIGNLIIKQRQEAKKEVFDDIEKEAKGRTESDGWDYFDDEIYNNLKQRHLNFSKRKTDKEE